MAHCLHAVGWRVKRMDSGTFQDLPAFPHIVSRHDADTVENEFWSFFVYFYKK